MIVKSIHSKQTHEWLLKKHYARRIPVIVYAFGLFDGAKLVGVCTYGIPASNSLCIGVCGVQYKNDVLELNRLCIEHDNNNVASMLVGRSLKMLPKPKIIVSYADTSMGHVGYVYQATNWIYTGKTKERFDMVAKNGGHSRHYNKGETKRQKRYSKHRYVYFVGSKTQRRTLNRELRYPTLPYPKGDIDRYDASHQPTTQIELF